MDINKILVSKNFTFSKKGPFIFGPATKRLKNQMFMLISVISKWIEKGI